MDLALSYLLLNHSTKATLVFRMYFNLYFFAGYIQEDVRIVLFLVWYIFSRWWYLLVYILFLSHISNSLHVFYACYNGRMSIVSTREVTFLCYLSIRLLWWLALWVIWCIMSLVAQSSFFSNFFTKNPILWLRHWSCLK